jgi:hypothetical protein
MLALVHRDVGHRRQGGQHIELHQQAVLEHLRHRVRSSRGIARTNWPASRKAEARLFRLLSVLGWSAPSFAVRAASVRSNSGIARSSRPEFL